ncbi:CDP-diacylglycerol--glycerol-3-phosphate 3-phosphatidyltransferase [Leucobacter chinensis]|uniref:CDP-diacylglycerol--glycerol-3-phosphate 3-phosphatidyltransferase n=1 Tax=Leucobacter chinensis TaxID=2851010 RepID=UPI001C21EA99|nr:CDP-diacylglycerol--glycerol-3-phosphate 3-phosphatidyltransferase [Leucobacter chinensis]
MNSQPVSNWNIANIITIVRIIATPFFLWMLLADAGQMGALRWAAAVFFIVAIASDALDGYLARSRGLVTDLGKLLDPIADKVLTGAAFIGLSMLGELFWWVTIIVLIREVGITIHRLLISHDVVVAAAWMGKLKTVAQAVAIALALFPLPQLIGDWFVWVNIVTMTVAVVLTIASGLDYVLTLMKRKRLP